MGRRSIPNGETRLLAAGRRIAALILLLLLPVLVLAGCETPRPDFTERTRQDCERGDRDACRLLDAFDPSKDAKPPPARPVRVAPVRPPRPEAARPTPVETDVQAIMKGIEQARGAPRTGYQQEIPSHAVPSHDVPMPEQAPAGTPSPQPPGTP